MALIDMTMSPELINKWIAKVKPFMRCKDPKKQEFKKLVREVQSKLNDELGLEQEEEEGIHVD